MTTTSRPVAVGLHGQCRGTAVKGPSSIEVVSIDRASQTATLIVDEWSTHEPVLVDLVALCSLTGLDPAGLAAQRWLVADIDVQVPPLRLTGIRVAEARALETAGV